MEQNKTTKQTLPRTTRCLQLSGVSISAGLARVLSLSLRFYLDVLRLVSVSASFQPAVAILFLLWGNICLLSPYELFAWILDLSPLSDAFWEHVSP